MIEKLKKLGLNTTEAELYMTLNEYERLSASRLAQLTNIKRTTAYASLDELVKKGLIDIDETSTQRRYILPPRKRLLDLVKKQEEILQSKKIAVKGIIEELSKLPKSKYIPTPKVRVIPDYRMEEFLHDQVPLWEDSMKSVGDTTWWGFQDHTFVENKKYHKWIDWYWSRATKKFNLKLFSNESDVENEMKEKEYDRREIRIWENKEPITATLWILGEYIISINTSESKHYLIQTHDALLAHNLRQMYSQMWKSM